MQFRSNLATRTYIDKKKLNSAIVAVVLILTFLLLVQIKICAYTAGEISRLDAKKTSMESKSTKKRVNVSETDFKKLTGDIKFANGILERKAFDWVRLLNELEGVMPDGLTLTSVAPDTKEKSLTLSGVSLNFKTLQRLLYNLEESHFFYDIFLIKQEESKSADSQKLLSFTISCKFKLKET